MASKTQDVNLTNSGANISTSVPHGLQCSEYYVVLNEVLYTADSFNPNAVSLSSAYFTFLINPNGDKKYIYIGIVSNVLEFTAKGIFTTNQARAAGHFYDDEPYELGKKNGW